MVATPDEIYVLPRLSLDRFACVGIDMPIGLVDGPPRECDRAARRYLAGRAAQCFRHRLAPL